MKKDTLMMRLSSILCIALIAASALVATGCSGTTNGTADQTAGTTAASQPADGGATAVLTDGATIGEGATQFAFTVTDLDGNQTAVTVKTDAKTVGEALVALDVIAGDDSEYGLYVKTVNGLTLDYDTDGAYWAFYIDGEYALTGVDSTDVTAGATYAFKAEKA